MTTEEIEDMMRHAINEVVERVEHPERFACTGFHINALTRLTGQRIGSVHMKDETRSTLEATFGHGPVKAEDRLAVMLTVALAITTVTHELTSRILTEHRAALAEAPVSEPRASVTP